MTPSSTYDRHRSRELDDQPPMVERKQDAIAVLPPHLQISTPSPSVSRWSRSSYSVSVSGDHDFSDEGLAAARDSADTAFIPVTLGLLHNRDDNSQTKKRIFGLPREMCIVIAFMVLIAITVAVLLAVSFSNDGGGPTDSKENSTFTHQQSTSKSTAITSDTSDGTSGPAVVTQVATQIIRTTVGTLTVNGSYAGTISSTITETSAPFIAATVQ